MFWFSAKPSTFNDLPRLPEKIRSVLKMKKKSYVEGFILSALLKVQKKSLH